MKNKTYDELMKQFEAEHLAFESASQLVREYREENKELKKALFISVAFNIVSVLLLCVTMI